MLSEPKSLRLTVADAVPLPRNGSVCPGRPPTWQDWRNGRLVEHPSFAALWTAFEEWARPAYGSPAAAPAVFCIRGRAGDGKSALLLQLAAKLLQQGLADEVRLFEAGDRPGRFTRSPGKESWCFVDRLPGPTHGRAGVQWVQASRQHLPRWVVTTATPSACEWLMRRYPRTLNWRIRDLPPLTEPQAIQLAPTAIALWREGDTLEQFLFACEHGRRLETLNGTLQQLLAPFASELLPVVWAANALGLAAPASLLGAEGRQALEDARLPVHVTAEGFRLTTPGLALPLLREWFPTAAARCLQLAAGFEKLLAVWLKDNEPAATSWFLGGLLHTEHFGAVFGRAHRKDVFRQLYVLHREHQGGRPAPVLVSAWLKVGEFVRLRPEPVEDAAALLPGGSQPPEVAAEVWLYGERRKQPLSGRTERAVAQYFAETGLDAGPALLRLCREARHFQEALPLAQRWLAAHGGHPLFAAMLRALFQRGYGNQLVAGWARRCLDSVWRGKAAGTALAVLLDSRAEGVRSRALLWLRTYSELPEAGPVLAALLQAGHGEPDQVKATLLWTAHHPTHLATEGLWELLLHYYLGQREVRLIALEWVREWPDLPRAAEMLLGVTRHEANPAEAISLVCAWTTARPEHPRTPALLEAVAKSPDETVERLLNDWLDRHPGHPACSRLLAARLVSGHVKPEWMQRVRIFMHTCGSVDCLRVLRALLRTEGANQRAALVQATRISCGLPPLNLHRPTQWPTAAQRTPAPPAEAHQTLQLVLDGLPRLAPDERASLAGSLGDLAADQPELLAPILSGVRPEPHPVARFYASLALTLMEMRSQRQAEWVRRALPELGAEDAVELFSHLLQEAVPLPAAFSQALATWLQRQYGQPAYRQMVERLRPYPAQITYLRSASLLPLRLLADLRPEGKDMEAR